MPLLCTRSVHEDCDNGCCAMPPADSRRIAVDKSRLFGNAVDLPALKTLLIALNVSICNPEFVAVNGGLNLGSLAGSFTETCPKVVMHGFEIDEGTFAELRSKFKPYPNVRLHQLGLSNGNYTVDTTRPEISAEGGLTTYVAANGRRQRGAKRVGNAKTVALADFLRIQGVQKVGYAAIDVEGVEPRVIQGMKLEEKRNRRLFGAFQWEAGPEWVDAERPPDTPDREEQVAILDALGYQNYLIGVSKQCKGIQGCGDPIYMPITQEIFSAEIAETADIDGNVLSIHPVWAHPALKRYVESRTLVRDDCCKIDQT